MPRALRICYPGALYHIIQRGNEQRNIFSDTLDYRHFLRLFTEAKKESGCKIYAYILMPNHFHLTIETPSAPISKIMHFITTSYALYFNKKYERSGHLFQGRFKGILVDKEAYLLELTRYIHLNPVKANLVQRPEEYPWSSYKAYLDNLKGDNLVDCQEALGMFFGGADIDIDNSVKLYKDFIESGMRILGENDDWLKSNLRRQRFLGSKKFIEQIEKGSGAFF